MPPEIESLPQVFHIETVIAKKPNKLNLSPE
jgi:hypothetical protein